MYKEYKQWKRIFAHPLFLIAYAIIAFLVVTVGLNFLLGIARNLLEGSLSTGGGLGSYIEQTVNNTVEGQDTAATSSLYQVSYLWTFQGQWWKAYLVIYLIASFFIGRKLYIKRMSFRSILLGL
ncbi:type IV secretory system conjugative DNA transfer family protein, partial [Listeria monocytogenes]|nr:type IV secretory system conjugative DNA transfer family protein [Listeria monocytogenes]